MRPSRAAFAIILSAAVGISCGGGSPTSPTPSSPSPGTTVPAGVETSTVTDAEGNVYRTVKIGSQWWMGENLKTRRLADGSTLPGVYVYNGLESHVATYGRLYTYEAANMRLIAGWHLPSEAEWRALLDAVGPSAGTRLAIGGSTGFNAPYGGYRDYGGGYHEMGAWGVFWSSTAFLEDHAYMLVVRSGQASAELEGAGFAGAHSVRLVRD